jgi:hypothetical protein
VEHLRHREQEGGEEPDAHLVVAPRDFARAGDGLFRRGAADFQDACADQCGVLARGRADEQAVFEEVEFDGKHAEADLRVARRRDVRVAVADRRHDAHQLDDDLVPRQPGHALLQTPDGPLELLPRHRVKEVGVVLRHLLGHVADVLAPPRRLVGTHRPRRTRAGLRHRAGLLRARADSEQHEQQKYLCTLHTNTLRLTFSKRPRA